MAPPNPHKRRFWTDAEVALRGIIPDYEAAAQTGRTLTAIYQKRFSLDIPSARGQGRPRRGGGRKP
jgi:hypothetical protein